MHARTVWTVLLSVALMFGSITAGEARQSKPGQRTSSSKAVRQPRDVTQGQRLPVTVNAYSPRRKETQGNPRDTASGARVQPGMVALSPDVQRALGVGYGDRIALEGLGTFVFHDRTASRKRRHVDIFMESTAAARQFGERRTYAVVAEKAS
jgi:3D (Asp-Asp-Asp) domain-containing protein